MKIFDLIIKFPSANIFEQTEYAEDPTEAKYKMLESKVVPNREGFFILKALHIVDNKVNQCYMDLSMPERINDYVYFFNPKGITYKYPYDCAGEVIPAIASEGFGIYELFFSKQRPDLSISILEEGLKNTKNKQNIALDLGYISRDIGKNEEAISAFELAIEHGEADGHVLSELARICGQIGNKERFEKYSKLAKKALKNFSS